MAAKQQSAAAKKMAFKNSAKKHADKWKDGREAKPGEGGFQLPKIDDGRYLFKVTGESTVGEKGKLAGHPLIRLICIVNGGDFDGVKCEILHDLGGEGDWRAKVCAGDLKSLMPDRADEISQADIGDLADIVEQIANDPVEIYGTVENGVSGAGKKFVNVRLEDQGAEDGDDSGDEGGEGDEPEEVTEDSDEPEEVVEGGDYEPEKKDKVSFKFRGKDKEGVVETVNRAEQTARIKCDGKIYPTKWENINGKVD